MMARPENKTAPDVPIEQITSDKGIPLEEAASDQETK